MTRRLSTRSTAANLIQAAALCLVLALAAAAPAAAQRSTDDEPGSPVAVRATAISFSTAGKTRFGRLTFLGGLQLTSDEPTFGGFSGLVLDADGGLMAVTDQGHWLRATLSYADGAPKGLSDARMGPIADKTGKPYGSKFAQDAEALRALPGGRFLIAYEHRHRVGDYSFRDGTLRLNRYLGLAQITRGLPRNQGLEALAVFKDGKELAIFAEKKLDADGNHSAWYVKGGKIRPMRVERSDEFDITDAVGFPDGSLILLERRFLGLLDGVHMRLRLVSRAELEGKGVIRGEVLFRGSNFEFTIDNMEGIDAYENEDGETVLAIISDDNFNRGLQRTLLLEFALDKTESAAMQKAGETGAAR
jgi:hypothetical protein